MNDEMRRATVDELQREAELGDSAREGFENEALQEAFDRLKQNYIAAWSGSNPEAGAEAREKLYFAYQATEFVERELKIMLDNGKHAARELEKRED